MPSCNNLFDVQVRANPFYDSFHDFRCIVRSNGQRHPAFEYYAAQYGLSHLLLLAAGKSLQDGLSSKEINYNKNFAFHQAIEIYAIMLSRSSFGLWAKSIELRFNLFPSHFS